MTLKINYLDRQNISFKNFALFLGMNTKISEFKGFFEDKVNHKILNFLKNNKNSLKSKIVSLNLEFDRTIVIILLANKKNNSQDSEKLGAKFYDHVKNNKIYNIQILGSSFLSVKNNIQLNEFVHGAELKAYEFNLYKSKKNKKEISFNILKNKNIIDLKTKYKLDAILKGVNFTRDLVSEPGNIRSPYEA